MSRRECERVPMKYRILWLTLAIVQALPAQGLTARQLFYKDEPEVKAVPPKATAPTPAPKTTPKAAPKAPRKTLTAGPRTIPESLPTPEARPIPEASPTSEIPTRQPEPIPVQKAAYVSERPLGLRYALVKVTDGAESEVSPTATFRSGDMVRVKVEGNRDGYLYVISRGSSGNWKPLFPAPDINAGDNRIVARRGYRIPSATQAFTFD